MLRITISYLIALVLLVPSVAMADRSISGESLPWTEDFNSEDYSDLMWVYATGSYSHQSTGSYDGSGCVRIFPGGTADQYYGIGQVNNIPGSNTTLYFSWAKRFSSGALATMQAYKELIIWPSTRPMMHWWPNLGEAPGQIVPACSNGTNANFRYGYTSDGAASYYPTDGGASEIDLNDYADEWIWTVYEVNSGGYNVLYIYTRDGVWSGEYNRTANGQGGSSISDIDILGGYFNSAWTPGASVYYDIDNVQISTTMPSIPTGFLTTDTGLPFASDFEENNYSEWDGSNSDTGLAISTTDPHGGTYSSRATIGPSSYNDNYAEYYFGDHPTYAGDAVDGVDLTFYAKFTTGHTINTSGMKLAIINFCNNSTGARAYQVYIYVNGTGDDYEISITNSDIGDWIFNDNPQNQGTPVNMPRDEWVKFRLMVYNNTAGNSDGKILMYINDVLKTQYTNKDLSESTGFTPNKLILSSYTANNGTGTSYLYHDDFSLDTWDGELTSAATAPAHRGMRFIGVAQ